MLGERADRRIVRDPRFHARCSIPNIQSADPRLRGDDIAGVVARLVFWLRQLEVLPASKTESVDPRLRGDDILKVVARLVFCFDNLDSLRRASRVQPPPLHSPIAAYRTSR